MRGWIVNDKEYATLEDVFEAYKNGEISEASYDGFMQGLDYIEFDADVEDS